jgi:hypothetical protein
MWRLDVDVPATDPADAVSKLFDLLIRRTPGELEDLGLLRETGEEGSDPDTDGGIVHVQCWTCGHEWSTMDWAQRCPACGSEAIFDADPDDEPGAPYPDAPRFRQTFRGVYEQYRDLDGLPFSLHEIIDQPNGEYDAEVLPLYKIGIAGQVITAWPEEVLEDPEYPEPDTDEPEIPEYGMHPGAVIREYD